MPTSFATYNAGDIIQDTHVEAFNGPVNRLESGATWYGEAGSPTGTSTDDYAVTVNNGVSYSVTLASGLLVNLKLPSVSNTKPARLTVNATATKPIRKVDQELRAGDLPAAAVVTLLFDASKDCFQLIACSRDNIGARGHVSGLVVARASNSTVDVDAASVVTENSAGILQESRSVNLTLNLASSGANGLDTGSEANSTWYFVWVIAKADGTVAGLLSVSSTNPTLPTGYTYKRLVSAAYNGSDGHLIAFRQDGENVNYGVAFNVLAAGSATTYGTGVSLASATPSIASEARLYIRGFATANTGGNSLWDMSLDGTNPFTQAHAYCDAAGSSFVWSAFELWWPLNVAASRKFYYKVVDTDQDVSVWVLGWRFPL